MGPEYQDIIDKLKVLEHIQPGEHFKRTLRYAVSKDLPEKHTSQFISPFFRFGLAIIGILMISGSGAIVASQHTKPGDTLYPLKKTTDNLHGKIQQQLVSKRDDSQSKDYTNFEHNGDDNSVVIAENPSPTLTKVHEIPPTTVPTTPIKQPTTQDMHTLPNAAVTAVSKKEFHVNNPNARIVEQPSPTPDQLVADPKKILPTTVPNEIKDMVKKIVPLQKK